jgi:WD40 repeat protein
VEFETIRKKVKTQLKQSLTETLPNHTFRGTKGAILSLVSTENHLISSSTENIIRVWNLPQTDVKTYQNFGKVSPMLKSTLKGHKNSIWSISVNPYDDQEIISCSSDNTIKLWKYLNEEDENLKFSIQTDE